MSTKFVYNQHNKLQGHIICTALYRILNSHHVLQLVISCKDSCGMQRYGESVISHLYSKHTIAAVNYALLWLKCEPNCCSVPVSHVSVCAQVCCSGLGVLQHWLSPSQTILVPFELINPSVSTCLGHHEEFNRVHSLRKLIFLAVFISLQVVVVFLTNCHHSTQPQFFKGCAVLCRLWVVLDFFFQACVREEKLYLRAERWRAQACI